MTEFSILADSTPEHEHISRPSTGQHPPLPLSQTPETTSSEGFPHMDFDNDGEWDDDEQTGPAIHTPSIIKDIVITEYRIEWLNLSEPENNFYAKNHMVATVTFATPQVFGNKEYSSARISMEVGTEKKVVEIVGQEGWTPGDHYNPGVYTVALLKYAAPTRRTVHYRTYPVHQGTTIGHLIDKIIDKNMHHFLFLPYTVEGRWKGCGDHTLHCWAHFVREGDITSEDSIEDADTPLCTELVYTYIEGGAKTRERIGRGRWVSQNPLEDHLTPETTFTTRRLTHQLPRKADDNE